jgi:hypothetical protein
LRLIDWLMPLPEELIVPLRKEIDRLQHPNPMPYVTSFERLARKEGRQEGQIFSKQQAVIEVLETRFDHVPEGLREFIESINDLPKITQLLACAARCPDLEAFAAAL